MKPKWFEPKDMIGENKVERMLTVKEVARLLHIHTNTVRRWSNQGYREIRRQFPGQHLFGMIIALQRVVMQAKIKKDWLTSSLTSLK